MIRLVPSPTTTWPRVQTSPTTDTIETHRTKHLRPLRIRLLACLERQNHPTRRESRPSRRRTWQSVTSGVLAATRATTRRQRLGTCTNNFNSNNNNNFFFNNNNNNNTTTNTTASQSPPPTTTTYYRPTFNLRRRHHHRRTQVAKIPMRHFASLLPRSSISNYPNYSEHITPPARFSDLLGRDATLAVSSVNPSGLVGSASELTSTKKSTSNHSPRPRANQKLQREAFQINV